jgi:hypothetical protein
MATIYDRLSAKIVFLRLLNDLPEAPSINEPRKSDDDVEELSSNRTLSFKHETCIVQQLAFLSAYSDDPVHTIAVCIEEAGDGSDLTIRFAVNSGEHDVLYAGLNRIATVLREEADDGSYRNQSDSCHSDC